MTSQTNYPVEVLTLTGSIKKVSLEFDPKGDMLIAYLRPDGTLGIWWKNPSTGVPHLQDFSMTNVQDVKLSVEYPEDSNTDIFCWYFRSGSLYLRLESELFDVEHSPYATGVTNPEIIQAGMNHRYGYQVDYRPKAV